jgi:hypothetical protein
MYTQTQMNTTDGVRIVFPSDWYVLPNARCLANWTNSWYICSSYNSTNQNSVVGGNGLLGGEANSIELYQF